MVSLTAHPNSSKTLSNPALKRLQNQPILNPLGVPFYSPVAGAITANIGGSITAVSDIKAGLEDNRRAIDEAKTLNAACLVLVVGALPGALAGQATYTDIARARNEVHDGIAASLEYAREVGMPLAIEPLHPMQSADRSCISTLEQALDLCDELDPGQTGLLGVALDVYHTWWDPKLQQQIARAGDAKHTRLLAYHVCDWLTPTRDLLNDRGMMGDGVIELTVMTLAVHPG